MYVPHTHVCTETQSVEETDSDSHSHDVLPTEEGVMIMDEVKVSMSPTSLHSMYIAQPPLHYKYYIGWNAAGVEQQKSEVYWPCDEELTTLCDVYQTLNPDFRQKQTSYILQTLWRDLTSEVCLLTGMCLHAVTCRCIVRH